MALITSFLERRNPASEKYLAWIVSLSGGLLFFYEFIQTNIVNSLSTQLMSAYHITAGTLGHLSAMYFYSDVLFLFFAGSLLDRFSTRKLILMAMVFCTVGTFGFGLADQFWIAALSRFLVGVGGSFCFLGGVRLASRWFPPRRMALLTGLIVTMAFIGGWVAQTPASLLVSHFGWRHALVLDGCLGVVLTIWIWLVVQDRPMHHTEKAMADYERIKQLGVWKAAGMVLKNIQNWYGGLYTCLLNLPIFFLGAMWGKMYLVQIQHFSPTKASFICSLLFIGSILGSPLMGFVSDKLGRRRLPMIIGAILSIVVVMPMVLFAHLSGFEYGLLFFLLGLITCSQVISYPLAAEHNPSALTGSAVSIVSMTCMLGGALGLPFSGWVLDLGWNHKVVHGVPVYSAASYHHAILIMPIAFAVGLVMALLVKETRCRSVAGE